ncbi:hypothetical protein MUN84_15915 [Hymenobacter sp. 5516J-16]|uniref:DUF4136 domain-containing protein n=1 Tax=Hymenobacter sublimis TaxID=2933777 RepID=A0ABY4JAA7_9BACT|nr:MULTISPECIES: hypothetical protein [Hymenobacter]UOQ76080.1 hypothetical protein MUN84_15915 [Hymenobacter sp. 5516J-16]UPL49747.1 hypothetical protein MWH26_02265 [Hymenobacter sublimis]
MLQRVLASATLSFLISLTAAQAQDAAATAAAMTDKPGQYEYRLSELGFEETFGFNDTARAVIRLYYAKWKTGRQIMQFAGAPIPIVSVLGKHYNPDPRTGGVAPNYSSYYYDPWVAPVAYSLLGVSAFGLVKATVWNRKQLYHTIRQYRASRQLPSQVTPALLAPYLRAVAEEDNRRLTPPVAVPPQK